jgi:hypothetical protein
MAEMNYSMSEREARLTSAYARFVLRNRYAYMLIIGLITVFLAIFVKDMQVINDPDTLLPPSNRYVATNAYAEKNFGMGNLMVYGVRVKKGDVYQTDVINVVQEIHRKLEELPFANKANFINLAAQKVKYMGADENGLVFKRLIPTAGISKTDPALAKEQLDFLKVGLEENPVMGPMLLYFEDPQGKRCDFFERAERKCVAKGTFIIADYSDEVKPIYLPWVRSVIDIMNEYQEDPRIRAVDGEILVAGEPYFLAFMLHDLVAHWYLFVISVAIVIVILWLEFRNWRGAVFPMIGVGATIVWTLGLMGFTQFKLTTMMVLTPMLLLAIGMSHSIQVSRRFMQEQSKSGDCEDAAERAISHTIIPAALAVATDVMGFALLSTVDISFYKDYAYFGMFGMLSLLLTTTTLIPLFFATFPCSPSEARKGSAWEEKVGDFLTRVIQGPGKVVPMVFVVGMVGWSVYYTRIYEATADDLMPGIERGIDYSRAAFKKYSITIQHIEQLNQIMPGVISVSIPIRGKEPLKPECDAQGLPKGCHDPDTMGAQGIFNDAEVLGDIEALENWMRANQFIGYTGSYAQFIRLVNMLLTAEPGTKPVIRDLRIPTKEYLKAIDPNDDRDPNEIVQLYNGLLETMTTSGDMDAFVSRDWNEGVVLGFINTMNPRLTHQATMEILDYLEQHKNDPGFKKVNFGLRTGDTSGDTNELSKAGPQYVVPGVGGFLGATEATREVANEIYLKIPMDVALALFFLIWLIFRSWQASALLMALMLVTLFAQYGLGGYFTVAEEWSANLAFHLIVALSIAMGIGVNFAIYVIARLREEMAATGRDWDKALRNTMHGTGSAVVVSVIVLLGSFIPLMGTELANTWSLALYISFALVIDVITALTLLPLMISWVKPKYVFEPG